MARPENPNEIDEYVLSLIHICKIIPDEDLRLALVVLALAYNKNEQANR